MCTVYENNTFQMAKIFNNELSAQAYKEVREMIMSNRLQPGQKIVQDKLAEDLGISRTPLRSALQMLEGEGLIESVPRKGVIVKEFSNQEIVEIYDCRIAMESTAVKLFAQRASDKDITILKELFQPFLKGEIDDIRYQKADAEFHDYMIRNCGNSFLHRIFQQSNMLVCIDRLGLLRSSKETLKEHVDIIDALEKRDVDLAESLIITHLDITKQLILKEMNGQ